MNEVRVPLCAAPLLDPPGREGGRGSDPIAFVRIYELRSRIYSWGTKKVGLNVDPVAERELIGRQIFVRIFDVE